MESIRIEITTIQTLDLLAAMALSELEYQSGIKDKTVIEYPSNEGKLKDFSNIRDFIEKDDHILFTKSYYFNGCEASNIIFLGHHSEGVRNVMMRAVKNLILVDFYDSGEYEISGMKQDKRFH